MITSNPTSEARLHRGEGNDISKASPGALCFEKCKNRGEKCNDCFKFNGERTEYRPKKGARPRRSIDDKIVKVNHRDKAARGDYEFCRKLDGVLADYRNFKDKKARKEIMNEYYGRQQEHRNHIRKDVSNFK